MAADIVPLKGAVANLNWFDAQRKHYETPDQIARRFRLPDDAAMRAFCQGAASLIDGHTLQFIRRVPGTPDAAWDCLADPSRAEQWLFGVQWQLRAGGAFRFRRASAGIASEGRIAEVQTNRLLELATTTGGVTRLEVLDVSGSSRARRDIPNYAGAITEIRITDRVAPTAGVPEQLQDTTAEQIAQPGGAGTHSVGMVAHWHRAASLLQKLAFEVPNVYWPPELAVGLDTEVLVAAYAKLVAAYHDS